MMIVMYGHLCRIISAYLFFFSAYVSPTDTREDFFYICNLISNARQLNLHFVVCDGLDGYYVHIRKEVETANEEGIPVQFVLYSADERALRENEMSGGISLDKRTYYPESLEEKLTELERSIFNGEKGELPQV